MTETRVRNATVVRNLALATVMAASVSEPDEVRTVVRAVPDDSDLRAQLLQTFECWARSEDDLQRLRGILFLVALDPRGEASRWRQAFAEERSRSIRATLLEYGPLRRAWRRVRRFRSRISRLTVARC